MLSMSDVFNKTGKQTTDTLQPKDKAWLIVNNNPVVILSVLESDPKDEGLGTKYLVRTHDLKKAVFYGNDLSLTPEEIKPTY